MSMSFTKLFSTITDSSIWCEDSDTKVVWVTMLAMADQFGRVMASIPGLAKRANVSIESTERALQKFLSPDGYSRTKNNDGRRIEPCEGGWLLLNHGFYRDLRSQEDRREQLRMAQARFRAKRNQPVIKDNQSKPASAQAEAEADSEAVLKTERVDYIRPSIDECKVMAGKLGMPDTEGEDFWHHYQGQGWIRSNGLPVTDWKSLLHPWRKTWEMKKGARPAQGTGFKSIHEAKIVDEECTKQLDRISKFSNDLADLEKRKQLIARRKTARDFMITKAA